MPDEPHLADGKGNSALSGNLWPVLGSMSLCLSHPLGPEGGQMASFLTFFGW